MKKRFQPILSVFLFLLLTIPAFAQLQQGITPELQSITTQESTLNWMRFTAASNLTITDFSSNSNTLLGLTAQDELLLSSQASDNVGVTNYRFYQKHAGITIEGASFHVQDKNGRLKSAIGHPVQGLQVNTSPVLDGNQALNLALSFVPADEYMWEFNDAEQLLQTIHSDPSASFYPTVELLIASSDHNVIVNPSTYRLVYVLDIYSRVPLDAQRVYIDAIDGSLVKTINLHRSCEQGTGLTRFNGTQDIVTKQQGNQFELLDECRGTGIQTVVDNGVGFGDVLDADNNWTANNQVSPVSVHWASEMSYDYFQTDHNRDSYDDNGGYMLSVVGGFCDNAFWNGRYTSYGKGCNLAHSDLVSLDVVGHEWTHAVTQHSAGLIYRNESGALNESFSDIFGTLVEDFAQNGGDYQIGEDFWIANGKLRDCKIPKANNTPTPIVDNTGIQALQTMEASISIVVFKTIGFIYWLKEMQV